MQQFQTLQNHTYVLVICTDELGGKIYNELGNSKQYFAPLKIGLLSNPAIENDEQMPHETISHIIISAPSRISALIQNEEIMLNDTINIIVFESEIMVINIGWLNQTTNLPMNKTITMIINDFFKNRSFG